jgi:hypothetical protein
MDVSVSISKAYQQECDRHATIPRKDHTTEQCNSVWEAWMQIHCICIATCVTNCEVCGPNYSLYKLCRVKQKERENKMSDAKIAQSNIYYEEMARHDAQFPQHDTSSDVCKNMWKQFMQKYCTCRIPDSKCSPECYYCTFTMSKDYCQGKPFGGNTSVDKPSVRKRIIAYKVLDVDFKSTYQGFIWPTPPKVKATTIDSKYDKPAEPGPWLEIEGEPVLCVRGFHGWLTKEKAFKEITRRYNDTNTTGPITGHVYEMEFEGNTVKDHEKICGTRARLVREIFEEQPVLWEQFVKNEPSAMAIIEAARKVRLATNTVDLTKEKLQTGSYPVAPAFHAFRTSTKSEYAANNLCGDCGLHASYHDGWEARHDLAMTFTNYDKYELLLYIQQVQNGKRPY